MFQARCGRYEEHGAHNIAPAYGGGWCAGNRNVITSEDDPRVQHEPVTTDTLSPFTRRALAADLPGKVLR